MSSPLKFFLAIILVALALVSVQAQSEWTSAQRELIQTINKLSNTTAPNGKGAEAYGNFLAEDFSRWTVASTELNDKQKWIEGIKKWFDEGWRVSEREQQYLEITVLENVAHTRRIVVEKYAGPKGESSASKAALAELWIRKNDQWLLYRVNVHPIPNN